MCCGACGAVWKQLIKMKSVLATVSFLLFFITTLVLVSLWVVQAVHTGDQQGMSNVSLQQELQELRSFNQLFEDRLHILEHQLKLAKENIREVSSDFSFFNGHPPTIEHLSIKLTVHNWDAQLKDGLKNAATTNVEAGRTLGPELHSTWTLYLTTTPTNGVENGSLNLHLSLDKWAANVPQGLLYAGLTAHVLGADGHTFLTNRHAITNLLGTEGHELSLHHFLDLKTVPQLLHNGSLRIRANLQLIGYGHRLYNSKLEEELPQRETQTVVFGVANLKEKLQRKSLEEKTSSNGLAFSKFELRHAWGAKSKWSAELIKRGQEESVSLLISLIEVYDHEVEWEQFFASLTVQVEASKDGQSPAKSTVTSTPRQDYMAQPQMLLHHIVPLPIIQKLTADDVLDFKISVTVYNSGARFYVHL